MSFSEALEAIKAGVRVARKGWNGKGMWVVCMPIHGKFTTHDFSAKLSHPILLIKNANGTFSTWVPSITDIFAEDWEEVQ